MMEDNNEYQDFTADEMLAILKAYESEFIKPRIDELSKLAKEELMQSKFSKRPILCNDVEVGNVILTKGGNAPYVYTDKAKDALDFMYEHGLIDYGKIASCFKAKWGDNFARAGEVVIFQETGETCDFLGWEEQYYKSASITGCKYNDVREAMQPKLGGKTIPQLLLGD